MQEDHAAQGTQGYQGGYQAPIDGAMQEDHAAQGTQGYQGGYQAPIQGTPCYQQALLKKITIFILIQVPQCCVTILYFAVLQMVLKM